MFMSTLGRPLEDFEGSWNENVSWKFHFTDKLPDPKFCTAVFSLVVVATTGRIILTRSKRGWEMLGGHLEPGESLIDAAAREASEEGGCHPYSFTPFGFREVVSKTPVVDDHHGGTYPPVAYIPHFLALAEEASHKPTAPKGEIFESRSFNPEDIPSLGMREAEQRIIAGGLQKYYELQTPQS